MGWEMLRKGSLLLIRERSDDSPSIALNAHNLQIRVAACLTMSYFAFLFAPCPLSGEVLCFIRANNCQIRRQLDL